MPSIATTLAISPDDPIRLLCDRAAAMGADVTRGADRTEIRRGASHISAGAEGAGMALRLSAPTPEDLHELRSLLEGFAALFGVDRVDWTGDLPRKTGMTLARVEWLRQISPSYRRLRLSGDFSGFRAGGLHFRLLLGPHGAALPKPGPDGDLVWPHGVDAWHRPPYTIRAMGADADWIDTDIFLHKGGRVTEWTDDLQPGEQVALTGPGGRAVRQAPWLGLVGDETALPVILRAIEAAGPDTRGHAMIVVPDAADAQQVQAPPGLRLDWVLRSAGQSPLDLFRALQPPAEGDRFLFFAGERQQAEAARDHVKTLGLRAGEHRAAAYWNADWVPPASQRQARG